MCVAFESTASPETPLVGSTSAEPSASIERKPPFPPTSPMAPSTSGAGMTPWKLAGTTGWLAESGLGRAALIPFTRAVTLKCPMPPSDTVVPNPGLRMERPNRVHRRVAGPGGVDIRQSVTLRVSLRGERRGAQHDCQH